MWHTDRMDLSDRRLRLLLITAARSAMSASGCHWSASMHGFIESVLKMAESEDAREKHIKRTSLVGIFRSMCPGIDLGIATRSIGEMGFPRTITQCLAGWSVQEFPWQIFEFDPPILSERADFSVFSAFAAASAVFSSSCWDKSPVMSEVEIPAVAEDMATLIYHRGDRIGCFLGELLVRHGLEEVAEHMMSCEHHHRGCWALDLLTGRQFAK